MPTEPSTPGRRATASGVGRISAELELLGHVAAPLIAEGRGGADLDRILRRLGDGARGLGLSARQPLRRKGSDGRTASADVGWVNPQDRVRLAVQVRSTASISGLGQLAALAPELGAQVVIGRLALSEVRAQLCANAGLHDWGVVPLYLIAYEPSRGIAEAFRVGDLVAGLTIPAKRFEVPADLDLGALGDDAPLDSPMRLFPFDHVRRGQAQMLQDVHATILSHGVLVANAPTGIGKTVTSLVPIIHHALKEDLTVFFLTSKQSQHRMAVLTLQQLAARSKVPCTVVDIIAKQAMCPLPESSDPFFHEFCAHVMKHRSCSYFTTDNAKVVAQARQSILHVEDLTALAVHAHVCPHKAALDAARGARVIVCDYNYLFSDLTPILLSALGRDGTPLDLSRCIIIVDEAHNLPTRVRDDASGMLSGHLLDEARKEVKAAGRKLHHLQAPLKAMEEAYRAIVDEHPIPVEQRGERSETALEEGALSDRLQPVLQRGTHPMELSDFVSELQAIADRTIGAGGRSACGPVAEFLTGWSRFDEGVLRLLVRQPYGPGEAPELAPRGSERVSLQYRLLDPSVVTGKVLNTIHAGVVMSGSFHPPEVYANLFGIGRSRLRTRSYDSPFDPSRRLVLVDKTTTTRFRDRTPAMLDHYAQRLTEVVRATEGNVAVFVPSYDLLEQIASRLHKRRVGKRLVVEERAMDKEAKEALVLLLRKHRGKGCVLVAVQGGSLSEGVDYPGNLLSCVCVIGVPLAPPSLETEAVIRYYDAKFGEGRGWAYGYLYPAMNKVLQSAGRLIRSEEDFGVVVLMDERFDSSRYKNALPPTLRGEPITDGLGTRVASFFATTRGA